MNSLYRGMTSGGAAQTLKVLQFFNDIGITVVEGYGLTETCTIYDFITNCHMLTHSYHVLAPVVSFNGPEWKSRRLGTVGVLIPGVEVRIVNPVTLESSPEGETGEVM